MSNTPRTDAIMEMRNLGWDQLQDFARKLERELSAVRTELEDRRADAETKRLDFIQKFIRKSAIKGFAWNSIAFSTEAPIRDQIDAAIIMADAAREG